MQVLHNRKYLKERRKNLRNNLTPAEATLWCLLQKKQLEGRKFRRQHSIGNYILDFYCPKEKIAIELDGAAHFTAEGQERDAARDTFLKGLQIKVLRIENKELFYDPAGVLEKVKACFRSFTLP